MGTTFSIAILDRTFSLHSVKKSKSSEAVCCQTSLLTKFNKQHNIYLVEEQENLGS